MILPPNTRLHLDPQDEYMHVPEAASNYNESMYFNAFDSRQGIGAWLRLGNRPNEGHAELSCCVYLPSGEVGFIHSRPQIADNRSMNAGGMRFDVIEPFRRLRVRYDGELLVMKEPRDMANPSAAFKSNPKHAASIDLEFEGISPMYGGEIVGLDGQRLELDPQRATLRGHTEQHLAVKGHVTVGGRRFDLTDATGYRDKSWGPRHWHNFYWYRWTPVAFDRGFGVALTINGREGDEPVVSGNVLRDGVYEPVLDAKLDVQWDDACYHKAFSAELVTAQRSYLLEGVVLSLLPLRHKSLPGSDPRTFTRITEAMTEYRCEGRTVLGMSEFCDLVTDGHPVTLG
jgi:hypothetical protein